MYVSRSSDQGTSATSCRLPLSALSIRVLSLLRDEAEAHPSSKKDQKAHDRVPLSFLHCMNKRKRRARNAVPEAEAQEFGFDLNSLLTLHLHFSFHHEFSALPKTLKVAVSFGSNIAVSSTQILGYKNWKGAQRSSRVRNVRCDNARRIKLWKEPSRTVCIDAKMVTGKKPDLHRHRDETEGVAEQLWPCCLLWNNPAEYNRASAVS